MPLLNIRDCWYNWFVMWDISRD